jgi:Flp pilus assembly protein TadB
VSKARALRRAEREAEVARDRARRQRTVRRRAFLRRLRPARSKRGRSGKLSSRLTRSERGAIIVAALTALGFIWLLVDGLSTRIALSTLVVIVAPMLYVLTLDRRT